MSRIQNVLRAAKLLLLYLTLAVAVLAAVPMLAGLLLAARVLIPATLCLGLVMATRSPGTRARQAAAAGGKASW